MSEQIIEIHQEGSYCYTYSADHEPVARVKPGRRVRIHCVDCCGNRLTEENQSFEEVRGYSNPQTGPIYIEGAEPGDTLLVHLEDIEITRDWALTGLVPHFGLMTETATTAMLTPPLPEVLRKLPIRDGRIWFGKRSRPLSPFMGGLGTAPKGESITTMTPSYYGGNLDCLETCPGNTIHFPVLVEGALFLCGDGHAAQGNGEIGGAACEVPVNLTCRFELDKGRQIDWPRITNDEYLMTIGCARPLEDAVRIACRELIRWVAAEYDMAETDALLWLTQTVELRVGNVCDPNYAVVAAVRREWLESA